MRSNPIISQSKKLSNIQHANTHTRALTRILQFNTPNLNFSVVDSASAREEWCVFVFVFDFMTEIIYYHLMHISAPHI
ncbi:hypothetical protein T492DRAFT_998326 [Pavlovales sp. CCMP2436]|nr:hypothetical protein T492DRAFT_1108054 [Pavlovales sp. CCMP2436]KAJ1631038.1 hypothetical protein T492DRAFT_998326 [Pavlovales sp. CCMP2436]